MDANFHLEKFNQWLNAVNQIDTDSAPEIDENELLALKIYLLMEGEELSADFRREVAYENAATDQIRATSRNIGRLAEPHYGDNAEQAFNVHENQVLPVLKQLDSEIKEPIKAVRDKIQEALSH